MYTREELLAVAREADPALGKPTISRAEFSRHTGVSGNQIYRHFDGWRDLCAKAGLRPNFQNVRLNNEEIFSAMRDTFVALGGNVTQGKFDKHFRYSVDVFKKRGLNWQSALAAFRTWIIERDPSFPFLDQLPVRIASVSERPRQIIEGPHVWRTKGGRQFGELLNFRGLLHAPVEEQGVVFLFGMVARELGYIVESVTTGFPDCEAKRRIGNGRWEKVRIEFEYQSRNFNIHGHNPNGCDVIVCWEHNWSECSLEVLELRTAIQDLRSEKTGH